jgi:hypothetical protein
MGAAVAADMIEWFKTFEKIYPALKNIRSKV